jgi:hypothetical protein
VCRGRSRIRKRRRKKKKKKNILSEVERLLPLNIKLEN